MTDQIKRKFPRRYFATSVLSAHFAQLHSPGSLTLTSMQYCLDNGRLAEKINVSSCVHILTHFLTGKNNSTQAHTNWQFSRKTAQRLNLYFIIIKIAQL
jgi:hypothetical protein